jgi:sulfite exporter TauE/SafE
VERTSDRPYGTPKTLNSRNHYIIDLLFRGHLHPSNENRRDSNEYGGSEDSLGLSEGYFLTLYSLLSPSRILSYSVFGYLYGLVHGSATKSNQFRGTAKIFIATLNVYLEDSLEMNAARYYNKNFGTRWLW